MIVFSKVSFAFRHGWFRPRVRPVLNAVDWTVAAGSRVALVGPSGSGKSTMVRLALGLISPDAGSIRINGIEPSRAKGDEARLLHRTIQWVPQHPDAAFDPRMTMEQSLREALAVHGTRGKAAREMIHASVDRLNLSERLLVRRPGALSGGEVQRFALARALLPNPRLLVLDEPTSMLDVSVQAEVMHLVMTLADERQLTVVLVTHDLALAQHITTRIDQMEVQGLGPWQGSQGRSPSPGLT